MLQIMNIHLREASFHELGVYSKNDGNALGIFSPRNVSVPYLSETIEHSYLLCISVSASCQSKRGSINVRVLNVFYQRWYNSVR